MLPVFVSAKEHPFHGVNMLNDLKTLLFGGGDTAHGAQHPQKIDTKAQCLKDKQGV